MPTFGDVEKLTPEHRRLNFECASAAITTWFRDHALTAQNSDTSVTFVVRNLEDDLVAGFYSLRTSNVRAEDAPPRLLKGAGNYADIPVVLLTRLAVDQSLERGGLGRALLKDALGRVAAASPEMGISALLLHAEDERAVDFYMKLAAFERSPTDPLHLLLLMKDLRKSLDL